MSDDDSGDDDGYEMETPTRKPKARGRARKIATPSRRKDRRSTSPEPAKTPGKNNIAPNYDDWEPSLVIEVENVLKRFNLIRYSLKELAPKEWNKECRWIFENARLKRQVEPKSGWTFNIKYGTNLLALLIHIAGNEAAEQYRYCARPGSGSPFGPKCVVSPWPEIQTKAYGNCYYGKSGSHCDHHNLATERALVPLAAFRPSQEDKTMKGYLDEFRGMDIPRLMDEMRKQDQRSTALQAVLVEKLGVQNPYIEDEGYVEDEATAEEEVATEEEVAAEDKIAIADLLFGLGGSFMGDDDGYMGGDVGSPIDDDDDNDIGGDMGTAPLTPQPTVVRLDLVDDDINLD